MHPHNDETTLIQQAQAGDQAALGRLYELHVEPIYKFMLYRTGDAMVAEDLTAEVFASMISGIARYQDRGLPFGAWLFRIARARLADHWRQSHRREKYREVLARPASGGTSAEGLDDDPEAYFAFDGLRQALGYLTQKEYEAVVLRFVGGMSNPEIAEVVHSNANAIKSRMRRALRKLRRILESTLDLEEEGPGS